MDAIRQVLTDQDLERLKFSQVLKTNPGDYASYVQERVDEITDDVMNQKVSAFRKADIDLARYMDMEHNANYYKIRNSDVDRLTSAIKTSNEGVVNQKAFDKDITKRQFEINEWQNYNKLETLFFLQVFFIAILAAAIIGYLQKNLFITSSFASLLLAILVIGVSAIGIYRYMYTNGGGARDSHLWHRRYFREPGDGATPPVKCDASGNVVVDANRILPGVTAVAQCADNATQRLSQFSDQISDEMLKYQTQGAVSGSLLGGLCTAPSSSA
jgi:hypothetical protein